jgi:lysophospholipase L1-like esterase
MRLRSDGRLTKTGAAAIIVASALAAVLTLVLVEVVLRVAWGLPDAFFEFVVLSGTPYAPHADLFEQWGPIPYRVRANAAGYRGDDEISIAPVAGVTRIVAIGDSFTNGFFVDNPDTYPQRLQRFLRDHGRKAEVINAARSGATITGEFDMLRRGAIQLRPAIVLLTFVTNDIAELMEGPFEAARPSRLRAWAGLLLAKTAIGEVAGRAALGVRYRLRRRPDPPPGGADRYAIAGGDRIEDNLKLFAATEADGADALVLGDHFTPAVEAAMQQYLGELRRLNQYTAAHGARLVFAYMPAYSQIYGTASLAVRDRLRGACEADRIPFIDLTPAMIEAGRRQVLHLAPVDFHLNPNGYAVMAEAIGRWLLANDPR